MPSLRRRISGELEVTVPAVRQLAACANGGYRCAVAISVLLLASGCRGQSDSPIAAPPSDVLTIGFGLASGSGAQSGIPQAVINIATEALVSVAKDGRPVPWLAQDWSRSDDGRTLTLRLRPGVTFHDGSPVTSTVIRDILQKNLPDEMGTSFEDVSSITATSETEIQFSLKQPSAFVLEGLGVTIRAPSATRSNPVGTGPFRAVLNSDGQPAMERFDNYYLGPASIKRLELKSYDSVRSAWAAMLRGSVDMLYDVGVDAAASLAASTQVRVFNQSRPYAYLVGFNLQRSSLRSPEIRRQLNSAINREQLVADALGGHALVADGPVWPNHWAHESSVNAFKYDPTLLQRNEPMTLRCLVADQSLERLALVVQQQLQQIGVSVQFEVLPLDEWYKRVTAGDFDLYLADATQGPSFTRPYQFWRSGGLFNWGKYSSPDVDAALDSIRHAANDDAYRAGVAAFQRAIVADPPAIFLAWSERARAVSTRFEVPVEPGRDILSTLRLWRPGTAHRGVGTN